jgi:NADPH:quinone reductase-like Zn-dependent oxidoreductase
MRAVLIEKTGGPEVLKLVADRPRPARKAGQVVIKTASAGVVRFLRFLKKNGCVEAFAATHF